MASFQDQNRFRLYQSICSNQREVGARNGLLPNVLLQLANVEDRVNVGTVWQEQFVGDVSHFSQNSKRTVVLTLELDVSV